MSATERTPPPTVKGIVSASATRFYGSEGGSARLPGGGDVEQTQLVGLASVVSHRAFHRISLVGQILETYSLDHPAVLHVETRNDPSSEHRAILGRRDFSLGGVGATPRIQQPVDKVTRPGSPGGGSTGDASRVNRATSWRSALRFGRNTLGPVLPVGAPPSRALSAGPPPGELAPPGELGLTALGTHATLSTGRRA